MMLIHKISLYLVVGSLLALAGWSQRNKITYPFSFWSFTLIVVGWPAVLGWVCYRSIFPGNKKDG